MSVPLDHGGRWAQPSLEVAMRGRSGMPSRGDLHEMRQRTYEAAIEGRTGTDEEQLRETLRKVGEATRPVPPTEHEDEP
jgi:hypothetical protein